MVNNKIENEILESTEYSDYRKWIITSDGSIGRDLSVKKWGLELVSSVMWPDHHWSLSCSRVWNSLTSDFEVLRTTSCGTHVHVSMVPGPKIAGTFDKVKRIAKAVVYFERCVDSLMPADRLQNRFCRSNRYNSALRSCSMSEILNMIDEIEERPLLSDSSERPNCYDKLVELLCPDDETLSRYYR